MLYTDEKTGSIKHEKYKPIPQQVVCSKCNIGYLHSKAPLQVENKDSKGRVTSYICKNCSTATK